MGNRRTLILTLPLGGNYGGTLQAYALQTYLKSLGIDAVTTNIEDLGPAKRTLRKLYRYGKRAIHWVHPTPATLTSDIHARINEKPQKFIANHIDTIDGRAVRKLGPQNSFSSIVVGSDQVWRKRYVSIPTYLLDFARDWDVAKISYAASFGNDNLSEYPPELLEKSAELAREFDAISVREDSGVDIAKEYWNIDAIHHIDPTMLIESDHYLDLLARNKIEVIPSSGSLFAYVLDSHGAKQSIADRVAEELHLTTFQIVPPAVTTRKELFADLEKYQLPPVEQWLQSFADADFVVTDSFHGTVFSILFHKPFLVVGNARRGLARFTSLLKTFGLEDRLVESVDDVTDALIHEPIDWERVEATLAQERIRSREYLVKYLK